MASPISSPDPDLTPEIVLLSKSQGRAHRKTPVSLLQELCNRRRTGGIKPIFEVIGVDGPVHDADFTVSVQLGDMIAAGTANTKQKARHMAAQNLLIQLIGVGWEIFPGLMPHLAVEYVKNLMPEGDTKQDIATNGQATSVSSSQGGPVLPSPISLLNELCMQRRWPQPVFVNKEEIGPPNDRQYTYEVRVGSLGQSATSTTKKDAKKLAAEKMLDILRGNIDEAVIDDLSTGEHVTKGIIDSLRSLVALRDAEAVELKPSVALKVAEALKGLNKGRIPVGKDAVLLAKIADRAEFAVNYQDLGKNEDADYRALVLLEISPVVVCYGQGDDADGARSAAAKSAIEYLKAASSKFKDEE